MLRTIYLQIALCEFIHQFGSFMEMSCKDGDFKRQLNVWPGGFTLCLDYCSSIQTLSVCRMLKERVDKWQEKWLLAFY